MKGVSDAIVVGGGPCGSFAALNLATRGVNVEVFEEHNEIGFPSHCPGHLNINGLRSLGLYPLPSKIVENTFHGAKFHSPKGREFTVRLSSPVTCVVNRLLFDKHIANMAEKAGAQYHLDSRVESLVIENESINGVVVKQEGNPKEFFARIVVDAEGISSRISRLAGLPSLDRRMLVNGVEAEVQNVEDVEPDMVEVFLGREYAPGFYAWLIPTGERRAKVGLAAKTRRPKVLLERLMLKHPSASKKLRKARILHMAFHPITLGGPISKTYLSGFLAVGDVASQVKPTTGGGVIFGMTGARIAAEVASQALRRGDYSEKFLSSYQKQWKEIFGFDVNFMLRLRKTINALSDEQLEKVISFSKRFKLEKALYGIKDLDLQGRTLLRLLPTPRVQVAVAYYLWLYLSANP
jgi:digeranylgeranylglycerophospholipid reductase